MPPVLHRHCAALVGAAGPGGFLAIAGDDADALVELLGPARHHIDPAAATLGGEFLLSKGARDFARQSRSNTGVIYARRCALLVSLQ